MQRAPSFFVPALSAGLQIDQIENRNKVHFTTTGEKPIDPGVHAPLIKWNRSDAKRPEIVDSVQLFPSAGFICLSPVLPYVHRDHIKDC